MAGRRSRAARDRARTPSPPRSGVSPSAGSRSALDLRPARRRSSSRPRPAGPGGDQPALQRLQVRAGGQAAGCGSSCCARTAASPVRVEDNGPGVPAALSRGGLREVPPGRRRRCKDKPKGTGLGLAICAQIVEHFGGRIWAEEAVAGRCRRLLHPAGSSDRACRSLSSPLIHISHPGSQQLGGLTSPLTFSQFLAITSELGGTQLSKLCLIASSLGRAEQGCGDGERTCGGVRRRDSDLSRRRLGDAAGQGLTAACGVGAGASPGQCLDQWRAQIAAELATSVCGRQLLPDAAPPRQPGMLDHEAAAHHDEAASGPYPLRGLVVADADLHPDEADTERTGSVGDRTRMLRAPEDCHHVGHQSAGSRDRAGQARHATPGRRSPD